MKNALKLGLILGVVGILMSLITRFTMDAQTLFSSKFLMLSMTVTIAILIVGGRKLLRTEEIGPLGYGEAAKGLFIASIFSTLITLPFAILIFGNDQELVTAHQEFQKRSEEMSLDLGMKAAGLSEAQIEAEKEEFFAKAKDRGNQNMYPYSLAMLPMNVAVSAIMFFFLSLLLALAVRQKGA